MTRIDFQTDPSRYRHWRVSFAGAVATLTMDVDPEAGLFEGCELKLNSYDLGVDIELADAVQRLRFEHPEVRCVVLRSGKPGVFCAGANIRMLAKASHGHKVNFCKFTNETRLAIEDASANSGQPWIAAVSGSAAGGGYELAMAAEHIMLIDDRRSGVALPELPLLAVLPATGGLTRLTDKRMVRRDRADVFCSTEEGVRGRCAVEWRLDDAVLHLRLNEPTLGQIVLRSEGDQAAVLQADELLEVFKDDWLVREIRLYLKRVFKRLDVSSRSVIALVEPGSC